MKHVTKDLPRMPGDPSAVPGVVERGLLNRLAATPRSTGSAALEDARALCARQLRDLGFTVREVPFQFSGFPGRFGTPLFGVLVLSLVAVAGHWGARGARVFPLLVLFWGGIALTAVGFWLARRGVLRLRLMREAGVNVEAARSNDVRVWLCAHLDSKSQPIPTLARAFGIVLESAGAAAAVVLALSAAIGAAAPFAMWLAATVVTLVGAIPVVLSVVGGRSPGALDNASGVATVLAAARDLRELEGVGVLLTDAEELGLAGAHAWAASRAPTIILNCDGVDDFGDITIMLPREHSSALREAIVQASSTSGVAHRTRGIPVGLLTDSVAFAQHGSASATFSRGSWSSLARVHSARDNLSRLTGRGIPDVARLMVETARRLARTTNN
jgi:hypothetical protein